MHEAIETTKASIQMVIVSEDYGGPVQLDEPSAEDLGEFRNLIERGGGLFTA